MKQFLTGILALLAALALGTVCRADTSRTLSLADVLEKHRQALGGAAALAVPVQPQRVSGTEQIGDLHGTFLIVSQGLKKQWIKRQYGIYTQFAGDDGEAAWQRDSNANVRLLGARELRKHRTDQYLNSYSYLFADRLPGKVTLRPDTDRKSGDYVLDAAPEGGQPCTLFLDPHTFFVVKQQSVADGETTTTLYSDFKPWGGVMTATVTRTLRAERRFDDVLTMTAVDDNADIPAWLFGMPPEEKNYAWVTPGATSATMPFDFSDNVLSLYVVVNGRPAFLVLDSGASLLGISSIAADKLHLPHQGILPAGGYGGSINTFPVDISTVELPGAVVFGNMTGRSLDHFAADNMYTQSIPFIGLIGYDLLSRFVVRMNFATREVTLIDPKTFQPAAADGEPLALNLDGNVPTVMASFDGLPPAAFLVDTGDALAAVALYPEFIAQNKLDAKYSQGTTIYGEGVGGIFSLRGVRARSLSLGSTTISDVPVDMFVEKVKDTSFTIAGALGSRFLSHFLVTFDYPHRRLFLASTPDTNKRIDTRTFGIGVVMLHDAINQKRPAFVVDTVDPDSPADKAGLNAGDHILKIDDQPAADIGLTGVRRLLSPEGGKALVTLSVVGRSGGTGTVKVSLYDPLPSKAVR